VPHLDLHDFKFCESSAAIRFLDQFIQGLAAHNLGFRLGEKLFLGAFTHRDMEEPTRHGADATGSGPQRLDVLPQSHSGAPHLFFRE